ncbi:hypothetical protein ABFV05_020305 [Capra hircus]
MRTWHRTLAIHIGHRTGRMRPDGRCRSRELQWMSPTQIQLGRGENPRSRPEAGAAGTRRGRQRTEARAPRSEGREGAGSTRSQGITLVVEMSELSKPEEDFQDPGEAQGPVNAQLLGAEAGVAASASASSPTVSSLGTGESLPQEALNEMIASLMKFLLLKDLILSPGRSRDAPSVDPRRDPRIKAQGTQRVDEHMLHFLTSRSQRNWGPGKGGVASGAAGTRRGRQRTEARAPRSEGREGAGSTRSQGITLVVEMSELSKPEEDFQDPGEAQGLDPVAPPRGDHASLVSPVTKGIFMALFLFAILFIFYVILWYICQDLNNDPF